MNNVTTTKLRPYQEDWVRKVESQLAQGKKVLAQLPTGGGKTVCFAEIAKRRKCDKKVLIIAHRQELIMQAADKIAAVTDSPIGIIKAGVKPNYSAKYQVASIQSLVTRAKHLSNIGIIIIDECFPAGTLVDGKPIESIQVGDIVRSYNESTGQIESKPVVRTFHKVSSNLLLVKAGSRVIECTHEHPFTPSAAGFLLSN
jgi:hypothetical protein